MPTRHIICPSHLDVEVLHRAFGWLEHISLTDRFTPTCEVCADGILAEVWTLQADDLAEVRS